VRGENLGNLAGLWGAGVPGFSPACFVECAVCLFAAWLELSLSSHSEVEGGRSGTTEAALEQRPCRQTAHGAKQALADPSPSVMGRLWSRESLVRRHSKNP
jgi:hypothetical protein